MRFELVVLFLLVGLCCGSGYGGRGDEWRDDGKGTYDEKDRYEEDDDWRDDDNRGEVGGSKLDGANLGGVKEGEEGGNKDANLGNIDDNRRRRNRYRYYPCDFEDDKECVRHYLASSGQCKETHNYGRQPVYRDHLVAYLPGFNLTLYKSTSRLKFFGDRISTFYVDKKTERLVMAVDFDRLNIETRYSTFVYQRRGQEPIKRTDFTNATLPVTLTAVIPIKKELDFKDSRVTAYISSVLPQNVQIGPRVLLSTQPTAIRVNAAIFANLPKAILELFLTEAPSLYFAYLQKYICDFGIPVSVP